MTKRKFAKRPRRSAKTLAEQTMMQARPEWTITSEQRKGWFMLQAVSQNSDKPSRGTVYLASKMLGPFGDLPLWLQADIVRLGVALPRTKYGRIPLGEALTWEIKRTKRQIKQGQPARTFYQGLLGYAVQRYKEKGKDYASEVSSWVLLNYAKRDLRRAGMHFGMGGVNKRSKPHRVRKHNPNNPNRWRKFSTRSLKSYWAWLVDRLKREATHQFCSKENRVLEYNDNLSPDHDRTIRHTRPKRVDYDGNDLEN